MIIGQVAGTPPTGFGLSIGGAAGGVIGTGLALVLAVVGVVAQVGVAGILGLALILAPDPAPWVLAEWALALALLALVVWVQALALWVLVGLM